MTGSCTDCLVFGRVGPVQLVGDGIVTYNYCSDCSAQLDTRFHRLAADSKPTGRVLWDYDAPYQGETTIASRPDSLRTLSVKLGNLIEEKSKAYGDSAGKSGQILAILYPDGVQPHQYDDALLVTRVLDKLSRLAQRGTSGRDLGGESPWIDVWGYASLGVRKDGWR